MLLQPTGVCRHRLHVQIRGRELFLRGGGPRSEGRLPARCIQGEARLRRALARQVSCKNDMTRNISQWNYQEF